MAQNRKILLMLLYLTGTLWQTTAGVLSQRFFLDDPIETMPAPLPVSTVREAKIDNVADFLENSRSPDTPPPTPAGAVNTLGEVPNSEWFTNRHATLRLIAAQLQAGSTIDESPSAPFEIISGKSDGIMPGFRMK